ncbi:MAG: hypothetical protein GXY86_17675 [Firmicutes bacterium]|nr:hypothetical protein [Bacillota bacterium]
MQIQNGGWKKVYLFYGVIFFSLGFLGFLFNSRLALSELARFILDDFAEELAEVGVVRSRKSRVVTVDNYRLSTAVLISRADNGGPQYKATVERIYETMAQKIQVVHYPASDAEWLTSPEIRSLIAENRFLIGVESSSAIAAADGLSIIFTLPRSMVLNLLEKLATQNPELPLFELGQINSPSSSLYRFSYLKPSVSNIHWMKVIDALVETWETMGYQRVDRTASF